MPLGLSLRRRSAGAQVVKKLYLDTARMLVQVALSNVHSVIVGHCDGPRCLALNGGRIDPGATLVHIERRS